MVPAKPTGPAQHRKQPSSAAAAASLLSLPKVCIPLQFADSSSNPSGSTAKTLPDSASAFPSTVRIAGLNSKAKIGGPAFVGQVFSMCDLSGTGLMAVSTHFDIPFISKRTPEWIKKIFSTVTKSERNGPVFRFFMDLGDAVSYVKRLNIPSGVVGACRLDVAYEHFKEKPHLFQFVPNEKQVRAANQLLKRMSKNEGKRKVDGVPVFTSQNLDIAIATTEGIKWYTPYFFDKNMLDNILEESVDQHFHTLIQTRHMQRRHDVIDDSLAAEVIEEMGDNLLEPPEVQEVLDEVGHPTIPLSVISKAAEIQIFYAVDRVLLGNRWFRKATGIQPKFPYVVDSFESRSGLSSQGASERTSSKVDSRMSDLVDNFDANHEQKIDPWFRFQNLFNHLWLQRRLNRGKASGIRSEGSSSTEYAKPKLEPNPFLPKITMVGISTGEGGQMNKASLKKTMEDLTKELEQADQGNATGSSVGDEYKTEERDPLFVGNVGDYYPGMSKTSSPRWVRGINN